MSAGAGEEPRLGWYGRCPCGGTYEERWVDVRFTDPHGSSGRLTDVPQGACVLCGSRVYKLAVLQRIEGAFKGALTDEAQ
ncbi:hypothetical protein ABCR94_27070 [Streptomyces sp. 21So2-11]|uniref:hypothetical protein n=1 Tax=Streptomyces sp. 21So2-11 TaxID=3144408 RepID=UPI00321A9B9B